MKKYTNTKIIATMGPASTPKEMLTKLFAEGVDVCRLNFSHEQSENHIERYYYIREVAKSVGRHIGLLLDTKGPEIRTHTFKPDEFGNNKKYTITQGAKVTIVTNKEIIGDETTFSVTYEGLYNDVEVGGKILIDDGYLELEVLSKDPATKNIEAVAKNTYTISNRKGVNVPNTVLNMPFISEKDRGDIIIACKHDFDYIAASFTRRAQDVLDIRAILEEQGKPDIKIIAKIENQEAIDNLDEIIAATDGIMVARGDLGVEVPAEEVPSLQKEMVYKCQVMGKIVVVATQMLESMQTNPRPTRAEVGDVANAVYEGADSTMLSGESAIGKYPFEAVSYMNRTQNRTELDVDYEVFAEDAFLYADQNDPSEIIAYSTVRSALNENVKAIVTVGLKMAKLVSKYRPRVPIFALVDTTREATSLAVYFAVNAVVNKDELANELNELGVTEKDLILVVKNNKLKVTSKEKIKYIGGRAQK